jgi:hypothetical protein
LSKYWLAAFAVPVVSLSLVAAGSVAANAEDPVNLIATYGTVQNTDGYMGIVGVTGDDTYLFNYTTLAQGTSVAAADVDCTSSWDAALILCDSAPTTNVSGTLTQIDGNGGYTSNMQSADTLSYIVVDLGASRTFSSLEVFQMTESDGAVTRAELYVSDNLTDTWPTQADASWTQVAAGPIADGPDLAGTGPYTNTTVTPFGFDAVSGRYVMFYFQNDGTYDADGWIEVAGVKLFGTTTVAAVPAPAPDPALAATGVDVAPAGLIGLLALLGGAALFVVARRRTSRA